MSSQRVFAEEIKLAARVIDERFASADRNLLLINDRRDLETYPIATVSGLSYALNAVAQKMDPERDILFLALSSHGSADPALAVSNGSLRLEQLTADDLSTALSESGIKRRIIVISACYSGAFIESLQDPNTIVITAAAADKTSFGCSDDRDLTYFGEAFYRDALPFAGHASAGFRAGEGGLGRAREAGARVGIRAASVFRIRDQRGARAQSDAQPRRRLRRRQSGLDRKERIHSRFHGEHRRNPLKSDHHRPEFGINIYGRSQDGQFGG